MWGFWAFWDYGKVVAVAFPGLCSLEEMPTWLWTPGMGALGRSQFWVSGSVLWSVVRLGSVVPCHSHPRHSFV